MQTFRTEIAVTPSENPIEFNSKIMFIGSCFAENMGDKCKKIKLPAIVNPYGIIYNPMSVSNTLRAIIERKQFTDKDLHYHNSLWLSFNHHGSFSHPDKEECLRNIHEATEISYTHLKETKYLFITFGTAWVYELIKTQKIVSNCHKYPARDFNRYILSIDNIVSTYQQLIKKLFDFNPELNIVFTVSPVRHWKDGANGNQISKSTLLLAINQLCMEFEKCTYFPAYELLIDDLRDYRFYADDMLHPSPTAVEYIWQKFENCFFSANTLHYKKEMLNLEKAFSHKAINPTSDSHQNFLKKQQKKIEELKVKYPSVDFSDEIVFLRNNII